MRARFILLILSALLVRLAGADLSGAWTLDLDPDFGGNPDTVECQIKQEGTSLSIQCGAGSPSKGEVHDRKVSFEIKTGVRDELIAVFTADLDERETTMKGTWRLQDRRGRFSATKR